MADLIQNIALVMKNKRVKFDHEIAPVVWKLWPCLCFSKSLKGGNFIKVYYGVTSFGQNVALIMVNKFVKFNEKCLSLVKVMAEIC